MSDSNIDLDAEIEQMERGLQDLGISTTTKLEDVINGYLKCMICLNPCVLPVPLSPECEHYYCLSCSLDFIKHRLQARFKWHTGDQTLTTELFVKDTKCPQCNRPGPENPEEYPLMPPILVTVAYRALHVTNHTEKLECPIDGCTFKTSVYRDLVQHARYCEYKRYQCPACQRQLCCLESEGYSDAFHVHCDLECDKVPCSGCFRRSTKETIQLCEKGHCALNALKASMKEFATKMAALEQRADEMKIDPIINPNLLRECTRVSSAIRHLEHYMGDRNPPRNYLAQHGLPLNVFRPGRNTPFRQRLPVEEVDDDINAIPTDVTQQASDLRSSISSATQHLQDILGMHIPRPVQQNPVSVTGFMAQHDPQLHDPSRYNPVRRRFMEMMRRTNQIPIPAEAIMPATDENNARMAFPPEVIIDMGTIDVGGDNPDIEE